MATRDRFIAYPTLIIGIGGTGLKIATFIKKNLLEANFNQVPEQVAFLVLDTEKEIQYQAGGWGQARSEYHATGPVSIAGGEYIPLTGNVRELGNEIKIEQLEAAASPEIRQGQARRHMSSWFQARYYIDQAGVPEPVWNLSVGAGRYRQFGRLGLFRNLNTVTNMMGKTLEALKNLGATEINVHVVGSLAGGTGAALFVDVAHLVTQLAHKSARFTQSPIIFGHFVLPEAFRGTPAVQVADPNIKADFDARAYAALRELTRLQGTTVAASGGYPIVYDPGRSGLLDARLEGHLYSAVYLYDGQRDNNPLNIHAIEEGLAPAIADAIVAYIDQKSSGTFRSHSVNYHSFYDSFQIPAGAVTYGTIGTYTIELPIYHITENWTHDLALQALDTLLSPDSYDDQGTPLKLTGNRPGGTDREPKKDADEWLRRDITPLVGQLIDWGITAQRTDNLRTQVISDVLNMNAQSWQQHLAPSNAEWRDLVAEAQSELDSSLKNNESKYYVNPKVSGGSDEEKASNLIHEVEAQLTQMVGKVQDGWRREGGQFRRALTRLGNHHVELFDKALIKWLSETLNGFEGHSTAIERKQAKLGYAWAFIEQAEKRLQNIAQLLAQAAEQNRRQRRPTYNALENELKGYAADMRRKSGSWWGSSNLEKYRDKSDEIAQFQKADIARDVVSALAERLQKSVQEVKDELELWVQTLGTEKAFAGGAYAMVMKGKQEVVVDRNKAKNTVRWVIEDDEEGDTYIAEKHEEYAQGQLENIMKAIEWEVNRPGPQNPIRINLKLNDENWDRRSGEARQRIQITRLLNQCRRPFEKAWETMSITAYLKHNFDSDPQKLAQKVRDKSGYMLAVSTTTNDPTMRTAYMRVYKEGLDQDHLTFLRRLQSEVSLVFKESTEIKQRAEADASESGENSTDRFKLTFIMFGDLLQPAEITGYRGGEAQSNYHKISGGGEGWRTLHILPAETNTLQIECKLSSGSRDTQQKRRELSEGVVVTLEDVARFRTAMRCLAYGETDYDWSSQEWKIENEERGLLLHKFMPRQNNKSGLKYWRLTVMPRGERRSDGRLYEPAGDVARPRHYQLTDKANEPDLLQAFIQLTCVGQDKANNTPIEWDRVEETIRYMMDRHREHWLKRDKGWKPTEKTDRDAGLLREAEDKGSQIIRLRAIIKQAEAELQKYPWAWQAGARQPANLTGEEQRNIQRFVDLWTAIRGIAQEEHQNLESRFRELASWKGTIPFERLDLNTDVVKGEETDTEVEEAPTPPTPIPPDQATEPEVVLCEQGHEMPPDANFCPICGSHPQSTEPEVILCEQGHEMPPDANFCPICGSPPQSTEPEVILCEEGHEMPPDANFCPICGSHPQ